MIFAALSEAAERGELILVPGGMLRWHLRKDGVVVVREVLVLPALRRTGVARNMIRLVMAQNLGRAVRARCPAAYGSNSFWPRVGFRLAEPATPSNGMVNTWESRP